MIRLLKYLGRQSKGSLALGGLFLIVLIGEIDYLTGFEFSFGIFYLLPIALFAWFVGRREAVAASFLSALIWLGAEMLSGPRYSHPTIPYWNALVRLGFFLVVAFTLSGLCVASRRREELRNFIVHDLRSPLGTVVMAIQLILERARGKLDAEERMLAETSLASCNRLLVLINALLDLGSLEHGRMRLQLQGVRARGVTDIAIEQVAVWARHEGVALEAELDAGVEAILADPAITARVLVNLLANAIKFSPSGSTVRVRVTPLSEESVAFRVSDQGRGIPKEWLTKVFETHSQVPADDVGRIGGSGLGLSFSRLAIEAQGGRIWLESEEGKGTTVTFTLPRARVLPDEHGILEGQPSA